MSKLCTDTLAALGFTCGVFHVEGKARTHRTHRYPMRLPHCNSGAPTHRLPLSAPTLPRRRPPAARASSRSTPAWAAARRAQLSEGRREESRAPAACRGAATALWSAPRCAARHSHATPAAAGLRGTSLPPPPAQVRDNNIAVWGVDLVEEHILTAAGIPSRPVIAEPQLTCRSTLYINAPVTGVMGAGDWMAEARGFGLLLHP